MLGFLHLARAHHLAGLRDPATAEGHLAEAARIAAHTGETEGWDLAWGPRNVALWRMAFLLDTGRPETAMETAATVEVTGLPAVRQVYFWLDMGRAAEAIGRDREAVRMLLAAERVGPQHARSSVSARETARALLRKGMMSPDLRGLCERMSLTDAVVVRKCSSITRDVRNFPTTAWLCGSGHCIGGRAREPARRRRIPVTAAPGQGVHARWEHDPEQSRGEQAEEAEREAARQRILAQAEAERTPVEDTTRAVPDRRWRRGR